MKGKGKGEVEDKDLKRIRDREEPGTAGPWKWQLIGVLERIARALEDANEAPRCLPVGLATNQVEKQEVPVVPLSAQAQGGVQRATTAKRGPDGRFLKKPAERCKKTKEMDLMPASSSSSDQLTVVGTERAPGKSSAATLIAAYCDAFRARYGMNPPIDGKAAGLAKNLLRSIPLEKACLLVQAYLQLEDQWFLTKCHDFPTFIQNLTKVAVALSHGAADPQERGYWARVFGGNDDQGSVSAAVQGAPGQLAQQDTAALPPASLDGGGVGQ